MSSKKDDQKIDSDTVSVGDLAGVVGELISDLKYHGVVDNDFEEIEEIQDFIENLPIITYRSAPEFMSHEERCGYAAGWNSLLRKLQAEIE